MAFRSGVVAVIGRPNTGKSSLVNALVGGKVAIVSAVPQTTRREIRGILTTKDWQVVFVDTPGFHKPRTLLGTRLNDVVGASVNGVDAVVQVVDAAMGVGRGDAFVFARQVESARCPKICAVNKVDRLKGHDVVPQLAAAAELGEFDEIAPVSAKTGKGVDELLRIIVDLLPAGPALYPGDEITDQPLEMRLAEIVREKALEVTREEVPHSVAVMVEEIEREGPLTRVHAILVVERDSQKGIVIGKGGAVLRTIGTRAREEIEELIGSRVYLDLRVKVLKEWQRDTKALARLGF